jgi:recombination protein RecR
MERSGEYRGYYHVLHGVWAPLKGQGADSMTIPQLIARTESGVSEVILATSATVEGDATALYISKILGARGIKNTRIAQGIPKGGELEFADDLTLARAFKGRAPLNPS